MGVQFIQNNEMALISLVIAIIALIISWVNYRQVKKDAYNNLAIHLIQQKNAYLEGYQNNSEQTDQTVRGYVDGELAANYCNAFEHACGLYLKGGIDKKLFLDTFRDEIISIGCGRGVASRVNLEGAPDSCYVNIKKVCEIIKEAES